MYFFKLALFTLALTTAAQANEPLTRDSIVGTYTRQFKKNEERIGICPFRMALHWERDQKAVELNVPAQVEGPGIDPFENIALDRKVMSQHVGETDWPSEADANAGEWALNFGVNDSTYHVRGPSTRTISLSRDAIEFRARNFKTKYSDRRDKHMKLQRQGKNLVLELTDNADWYEWRYRCRYLKD